MADKKASVGFDLQERRDFIAGRYLDRAIEAAAKEHDLFITGLNFRWRGGEWMLIAKCVAHETVNEVAFVTGETMAACLRTFGSKLENGMVDWREDKPWKP